MNNPRLLHKVGIAAGAIALIVVIAIAMGGGDTKPVNATLESDRVAADITSQAYLIRNKIFECYTSGYDNTDLADKYPASTGAGTLVEMLECPSYNTGVQNLWTGQAPAGLPPSLPNFDQWYYVNAGLVGGRCLRIKPLAASADIKSGLAQVATALPLGEVLYDPDGVSQRFIVWITVPVGSPSLDCGN